MKKVLVGVTGGIAAYKSAELVRLLIKEGLDVTCAMTPNAEAFITPMTLGVLSTHPVCDTMFAPGEYEPRHIRLAQAADLVVVAPATADFIARAAHGMADDLLSATLLAATCPVLFAPSMNDAMWANPATQENVRTLAARGYSFCGPGEGFLACGTQGAGRMREPRDIADDAMLLLGRDGDCAHLRVLVTAGPTREAIDPVRFISNRSSGRMGYAIAKAAARRGAEVTLVSGPCALQAPRGVRFVPVETTRDMLEAALDAFGEADVVFKAAAPADYAPAAPASEKLAKADGLSLSLENTPDVLQTLGAKKTRQFLVGFAAESFDGLAHAREKLVRKNLDLMVLNDVTKPGAGFDVPTNIVTVLDADSAEDWPLMSKDDVAGRLITRTLESLRARRP